MKSIKCFVSCAAFWIDAVDLHSSRRVVSYECLDSLHMKRSSVALLGRRGSGSFGSAHKCRRPPPFLPACHVLDWRQWRDSWLTWWVFLSLNTTKQIKRIQLSTTDLYRDKSLWAQWRLTIDTVKVELWQNFQFDAISGLRMRLRRSILWCSVLSQGQTMSFSVEEPNACPLKLEKMFFNWLDLRIRSWMCCFICNFSYTLKLM